MSIYRGKYPLGGNHDGCNYTAWATPKFVRHLRWQKFKSRLTCWFGLPLPKVKFKPEYLAPHLREGAT